MRDSKPQEGDPQPQVQLPNSPLVGLLISLLEAIRRFLDSASSRLSWAILMEQIEPFRCRTSAGRSSIWKMSAVRRTVLEQYDQEHKALLRYLSCLGVDRETGQEIVQESFLKLHEHLLMGGDRTNLRAWLYRVSHNLARNFQSSFRTAKTDYLSDLTADGDIAGATVSAEERLLEAERPCALSYSHGAN